MIGNRFRNWWQRERIEWGPSFDSIRVVAMMADVPDETGSTIYVVGGETFAKWAVFSCPCGAGHQLRVPLADTLDPHWRLTVRKGLASLSPSVAVSDGICSSHFWLRNSRIQWARWAWER